MKKLHFIVIALFFANLITAQDCLPETRMDDAAENKAVAKILKYYCMDKGVVIKGPKGMFGDYKYMKGEYLRHTFVREWNDWTDAYGNPVRNAFVAVGVKSETGECTIAVLRLFAQSLGGGKWGTPIIADMFGHTDTEGSNLSKKYFKENVSCECIMKMTDWLGNGSSSSGSNNVTTNSTASSNQVSEPAKTVASNIAANDASSLPPLDKKKPGYYEAKDGNNLSDHGYRIKGKLEGEYRAYSNGKVEYVYNYKAGKREGPAAEYYENGKVKCSGLYKNDKKEGEWKRFTEAGKPAGTDIYENGEKQ